MYDPASPSTEQFPRPPEPAPLPVKKRSGPPRFLASDLTLGLLVLIMTVVTAWSSYQSDLAGGKEDEANLMGQRTLTAASTVALSSVQAMAQDASAIDNFMVHQDDPELSAYFQSRLSDEMKANMNPETGEVNGEAYTGAVLKDAQGLSDESDHHFSDAEAAGDAADSYQLIVLIFALGIALAGLGSLRRDKSWLRAMFAIGAFATLVLGGVLMAGIDFVALTA